MEKRIARIILECLSKDNYIDREDFAEVVCAINKLVKNDDSDVDLEWSGNGFSSFAVKFREGDRVWDVKEFRATEPKTGETIVIYTDCWCKFFLTKLNNVMGETLGFCIASKTKFGDISSAIERRQSIMSLIEKSFKDGQKALDRKLNIIQSVSCIDYHFEVFDNESKTA